MTILKATARDTWSNLLGRTTVFTFVLALHVGMLWLFVSSARRPPAADDTDASSSVIVLRFLPTASKPSVEAVQPKKAAAAQLVKPRTRPINKRAPIISASVATPSTALVVPPQRSTSAIDWNLPSAPQPASSGSFASRLSAAQDQHVVTHLPGSSTAIVGGLQMTDPRNQGIAGAVRTMQAILGVPNPHCVDVAVWRALSTQELLDRHISPSQVDSTAEEYRCRFR